MDMVEEEDNEASENDEEYEMRMAALSKIVETRVASGADVAAQRQRQARIDHLVAALARLDAKTLPASALDNDPAVRLTLNSDPQIRRARQILAPIHALLLNLTLLPRHSESNVQHVFWRAAARPPWPAEQARGPPLSLEQLRALVSNLFAVEGVSLVLIDPDPARTRVGLVAEWNVNLVPGSLVFVLAVTAGTPVAATFFGNDARVGALMDLSLVSAAALATAVFWYVQTAAVPYASLEPVPAPFHSTSMTI